MPANKPLERAGAHPCADAGRASAGRCAGGREGAAGDCRERRFRQPGLYPVYAPVCLVARGDAGEQSIHCRLYDDPGSVGIASDATDPSTGADVQQRSAIQRWLRDEQRERDRWRRRAH